MSGTGKTKKLLFSVSIHDCRVDHFTCGGKGGGGKDTNNSGSRVVHEPSGATGECREERHQHINTQRAFRRMTETSEFRVWHRMMVAKLMGEPSVEERVEAAMDPSNLKVEARVDGKWVEIC